MARPSAHISGGFDVTATSQIVVPEYSSRRELSITNNSDNDVSLALRVADGLTSADPVAVDGDGIVLKAQGGNWTTQEYTGPVAGIAGVAGPSRIAIVEI